MARNLGGLSSGRQLAVSRLASRWADTLRSRGLLSAPQEPRLASSVALLRAVAKLHRNAVRDPSSCRHGPSRTVPRVLLATLDEVQRSLASSVQDSLSLHLSGYGVCVQGARPRERVTKLGLPNGTLVNLEPASAARCLVMDVSPFPCADDSLLNTQFVMVKRADSHSTNQSSVMVELFLRKLRPETPLTTNNRAYATRGLVTLHKLDVPAAAAGFDLLVHLEPEKPIDLLQVTFSAGHEPTEAEILRSPGPEWRGNRTLVPRVALGGRPLYVAVRLKLEWGVGALRPADPRRVRYRLWAALVACRSWRRPAWSGRGCAVVLDSSLETLHCRCSHLSWFSGAHWVAPNEISWRKIASADTAKLQDDSVIPLVEDIHEFVGGEPMVDVTVISAAEYQRVPATYRAGACGVWAAGRSRLVVVIGMEPVLDACPQKIGHVIDAYDYTPCQSTIRARLGAGATATRRTYDDDKGARAASCLQNDLRYASKMQPRDVPQWLERRAEEDNSFLYFVAHPQLVYPSAGTCGIIHRDVILHMTFMFT
ncbi:hypothetical protein HPB51_011229 [Rhipicephalus microplus]|uniref:Uncharacterized protein n=1 Tax=Rhipicephalus microplus TaxID=6941 RepID=A0A9J6F2L4_RHIMP|nr:hypothetical protein HPB51_011229 [Rhipicephalus microplus]